MLFTNARATLRVSFAAVFLVALAGCGGDDDGGTTTTPPASSPVTGNTAPTIAGQPGSSVLAGRSFTFAPSASDADGDKLTFAATNLPSWAALDSSTGRVTGTPGAADVGSYANITLTVSDGTASASLKPFSITVTASAAGNATVSWTAPTHNSDGSTLTNLAGYRILYGTSADALDQSISVDNPSVSTYVVDNLTAGTWYFALVAVNTDGASSGPSDIASKKIG